MKILSRAGSYSILSGNSSAIYLEIATNFPSSIRTSPGYNIENFSKYFDENIFNVSFANCFGNIFWEVSQKKIWVFFSDCLGISFQELLANFPWYSLEYWSSNFSRGMFRVHLSNTLLRISSGTFWRIPTRISLKVSFRNPLKPQQGFIGEFFDKLFQDFIQDTQGIYWNICKDFLQGFLMISWWKFL